MPARRLIARLDIKGPNVIKGVHLEGLKIVGDPNKLARRYYESGIDEIVYVDSVASLYGRNNLLDVVAQAVREIFVPITVGGGIRSVADATQILRAGADKIAINTAAIERPNLITEITRKYGKQCLVLLVEAKRRRGASGWDAYCNYGRQKTSWDVIDWVSHGVECGAGEILLTSLDMEGTRQGFDLNLVAAVSNAVSVPVIASGGLGTAEHAISAFSGGAAAVAIADAFHFERLSIGELRAHVANAGYSTRIP